MKTAGLQRTDRKNASLVSSLFRKTEDSSFTNISEKHVENVNGPAFNFGNLNVHHSGSAFIQPKLQVNQPGDQYEQEADAMADKVMRMKDPATDSTVFSTGALSVQRKCAHCEDEEKEKLQRKESSNSSPSVATTIVQNVLESSSGRPMDGSTRSFMESRFNRDFSNVKIHDDDSAAESAGSINAYAYTLGNNVVFNKGKYSPDTEPGKRLLAHELTHVIQQNGPGNFTNRSDGNMIQRDGPDAGTKAPAKPAAPLWTVDELKKMLDTCDGGLGIWAKAKKANHDKDPTVIPGAGGETDPATGIITIDQSKDKCFAVQQLVQELSNLSRKGSFDALDTSALAGNVNRADYIKKTELIEYESGVKNVLTAFDACKDKWPCKTSPKEWARAAKDFDEYFNKLLSDEHKEGYGTWWDTNCKAAYDKKHPTK